MFRAFFEFQFDYLMRMKDDELKAIDKKDLGQIIYFPDKVLSWLYQMKLEKGLPIDVNAVKVFRRDLQIMLLNFHMRCLKIPVIAMKVHGLNCIADIFQASNTEPDDDAMELDNIQSVPKKKSALWPMPREYFRSFFPSCNVVMKVL
jgi:hypothetical protein